MSLRVQITRHTDLNIIWDLKHYLEVNHTKTMAQQLIEEHEIKIEIAEIKVEECYNWANDLVLADNKNWYEEFEPVRWIEAKVNLKPVENVCKCKKNMVITRGMASKHKKYCYLLYN